MALTINWMTMVLLLLYVSMNTSIFLETLFLFGFYVFVIYVLFLTSFVRELEFPVKMLLLERQLLLPRMKLRDSLHAIQGVITALAYVTVKRG